MTASQEARYRRYASSLVTAAYFHLRLVHRDSQALISDFFQSRRGLRTGRRSHSGEILNIALLRLRFHRRCGLALNRNASFEDKNP